MLTAAVTCKEKEEEEEGVTQSWVPTATTFTFTASFSTSIGATSFYTATTYNGSDPFADTTASTSTTTTVLENTISGQIVDVSRFLKSYVPLDMQWITYWHLGEW